jgi:hypothetical protein
MLKIVFAIAFVFTALGILCAVWIARKCGPVRIGRLRPPAADPFSHPFGDIAFIDPARPASRADQGSGGNGNASQGAAAARTCRGEIK